MPVAKGISVVIPNYNGEHLLPQILPPALHALQQVHLPFEIIVVDDCSTDASVKLLHEKFSYVSVIEKKTNHGFSVTANTGIFAARFDWVLLLNSDVKLDPDYFKPLIKYTGRSDIFGVTGRVLGWDDEIIQDAAKYPQFHGVKIKTSGNYLLQNEADMQDGLMTMYLSGSNAFMNKDAFCELGGFNILFSPYYVEDFELSLRAWRMGYSCYFDYNAVCRHRTSTTISGSNKKNKIKTIYNRNKMFLHYLHLTGNIRVLWFIQILLESIVQLIIFKGYFIKAFILFLGSYGKISESRKSFYRYAHGKKIYSVPEIVNHIKSFVHGKKIVRF